MFENQVPDHTGVNFQVEHLVVRAGRGDRKAKALLIEQFKPLVYKYAARYAAGEEFEEYCQEGYLLLLRLVERCEVKTFRNFAGYLKKSLITQMMGSVRKKKVEQVELNEQCTAGIGLEPDLYDGEEKREFDEAEFYDILWRVARHRLMSRLDREIYSLMLKGLKNVEIARKLEMETKTVMYHTRKIKNIMRSIRADEERERMVMTRKMSTAEIIRELVHELKAVNG